MNGRIILLIFVLIAKSPLAQTTKEDFDFVMYLIGNGMKEDAEVLLQNTKANNDSIYFLKGYTDYSNKKLDSAVKNFSLVSKSSDLFTESNFFASLSAAHLGDLGKAVSLIDKIDCETDEIVSLKNFELAGISLLKRDYDDFDRYIIKVDTNNNLLSVEANNLLAIKNDLISYKKKSPLLAAVLSAVVPGLGKVYAGNTGEGIAAFCLCAPLMAATAENWYKNGITNWKTIAFGVLSAVFYVGNILGTIATVKFNVSQFNNRNDVQILYNIHIPLRNTFRR